MAAAEDVAGALSDGARPAAIAAWLARACCAGAPADDPRENAESRDAAAPVPRGNSPPRDKPAAGDSATEEEAGLEAGVEASARRRSAIRCADEAAGCPTGCAELGARNEGTRGRALRRTPLEV